MRHKLVMSCLQYPINWLSSRGHNSAMPRLINMKIVSCTSTHQRYYIFFTVRDMLCCAALFHGCVCRRAFFGATAVFTVRDLLCCAALFHRCVCRRAFLGAISVFTVRDLLCCVSLIHVSR